MLSVGSLAVSTSLWFPVTVRLLGWAVTGFEFGDNESGGVVQALSVLCVGDPCPDGLGITVGSESTGYGLGDAKVGQ